SVLVDQVREFARLAGIDRVAARWVGLGPEAEVVMAVRVRGRRGHLDLDLDAVGAAALEMRRLPDHALVLGAEAARLVGIVAHEVEELVLCREELAAGFVALALRRRLLDGGRRDRLLGRRLLGAG